MAIDTKHPAYIEFASDWQQLRDTYRCERIIKEAGFRYLPATSGMIADGIEQPSAPGYKAYTAYKMRARYTNLMKEAVEAMLGVMHHKPALIELPKALEPLLKKATLRNESLQALLRRINEEQLTTGRLGLLLEIPEKAIAAGAPNIPLIALYEAEDIINWDQGTRDGDEQDMLNLVVLDETEYERSGFEWESVEKYRVLVIGDPISSEMEDGIAPVYRVGVFREKTDFNAEELTEPSISGRKLDRIPFQFINAKDVVPTPDDGPLLDLSNLCLTLYRGNADYRQSLFMQSQDTWVEIGAVGGDEDEPRRLGAGARVSLPLGGDAKYEGVNSQGLEEQRLAQENDRREGSEKAGALIEAVSRAAESGEALRVRVAARTASLNQIAMAGAFGLQELLRQAAVWVGANPEEVIVEPNLDFVSDTLAGQELVQLLAAKGLGAPLSLESLHTMLRERGLTEKTWEEELAQLEKEALEGLPGARMPGEKDSETADPEEDEEPGNGEDAEDDNDAEQ